MRQPACTVVFVHGLWMTGHESLFLRRDLQGRLDAQVLVFTYRTVVNDMAVNAAALKRFLGAIGSDSIHLVGHSLGGLVILKCLEDESWLAPGRIVLLGSPVQGSQSARTLAQLPLFRAMLGRGMREAMAPTQVRRWLGKRDLGMIAGNLSMGLGRLVGQLSGANDGTVSVEETQLEGATDRIVLRVSHTGMMFAGSVAQQTSQFLLNGRFRHPKT